MGIVKAASNHTLTLLLSFGIGAALCSQLSHAKKSDSDSISSDATANRIAELQVVDCLLPGQLRSIGNRTYMTPRRPAVLTAAECKIRGGEFVAMDRADLRTALKVWLPTAEEGDADAQVNVGEIFEKGTDGVPNYEAAIIWYQKAAKQNNKRAQFNLGTLYEQGLGVEKDPILALDLYRKAWGLPEDSLVFQSAVDEQQSKLLDSVNKEIRKKDLQIKIMNSQLAELQAALQKQDDSDLLEQVEELKNLVAELELESNASKEKKLTLQQRDDGLKLRTPMVTATAKAAKKKSASKDVTVSDINFGKYFALVIGVENYDKINDLETPVNDTNTIADILSSQYGFEVQKVINADQVGVMEAINNVNDQLGENDNLLIFYAGHGARLNSGNVESGYWLPTNAEGPPRDTYWVSNEFVTRHLARIKAKRVMVISDSCYAGLLSSEPGFLMMGENGKYSNEYIKYKASKRSRLLLASGGNEPVLDGQGGSHSIFASALITALRDNNGIMSGPQLFMKVRDHVSNSAKKVNFDQTPEYKTIKGAGHEVGDFFFIPTEKNITASIQ
ncbi:MAG: caspase family protein [Pseudomonadales bacterium]